MATALGEEQVAAAAAFLRAALQSGEPLPPIPAACRPQTVADGMRIAALLPAAAEVVGWKAGASSAAQLRDLGLTSPPSARLGEGVLIESPAQLDADQFNVCVMEAEVAFRLGADLPHRNEPYSQDEVRAAIGSAHIVIEAVNVPFADGMRVGLPSIVAAGFGVGNLVLGPSVEDWSGRDLTTLDVELLIDGEVAARGLVGDARCDPLGVLLALANDERVALHAGQVVTTGAAATPTPASPGQTATARFAGVGEVVARLG